MAELVIRGVPDDVDQCREAVRIGGRWVRHVVAQQNYECACGARLIARFGESGWETVCREDASHPPASFVARAQVWHAEVQRALVAEEADEVFEGLPAWLQEAIERRERCQS